MHPGDVRKLRKGPIEVLTTPGVVYTGTLVEVDTFDGTIIAVETDKAIVTIGHDHIVAIITRKVR